MIEVIHCYFWFKHCNAARNLKKKEFGGKYYKWLSLKKDTPIYFKRYSKQFPALLKYLLSWMFATCGLEFAKKKQKKNGKEMLENYFCNN